MRRICCVCKAVMGEVPGPEGDSHGYCEGCHALTQREYGLEPSDADMVNLFKEFWWGGDSARQGTRLKGIEPEQLKMGMEVELEHTDDVGTAAKIALDHLTKKKKSDQANKYYTGLHILEAILDQGDLDRLIEFARSIGIDG